MKVKKVLTKQEVLDLGWAHEDSESYLFVEVMDPSFCIIESSDSKPLIFVRKNETVTTEEVYEKFTECYNAMKPGQENHRGKEEFIKWLGEEECFCEIY